jgi:hypothetical protein
VTHELPEVILPGVGVGVEVDQRNLSVTVNVGDAAGVWERDRVVAAEDYRNTLLLSDPGDRAPNTADALIHIAGDHTDIAKIDDA